MPSELVITKHTELGVQRHGSGGGNWEAFCATGSDAVCAWVEHGSLREYYGEDGGEPGGCGRDACWSKREGGVEAEVMHQVHLESLEELAGMEEVLRVWLGWLSGWVTIRKFLSFSSSKARVSSHAPKNQVGFLGFRPNYWAFGINISQLSEDLPFFFL